MSIVSTASDKRQCRPLKWWSQSLSAPVATVYFVPLSYDSVDTRIKLFRVDILYRIKQKTVSAEEMMKSESVCSHSNSMSRPTVVRECLIGAGGFLTSGPRWYSGHKVQHPKIMLKNWQRLLVRPTVCLWSPWPGRSSSVHTKKKGKSISTIWLTALEYVVSSKPSSRWLQHVDIAVTFVKNPELLDVPSVEPGSAFYTSRSYQQKFCWSNFVCLPVHSTSFFPILFQQQGQYKKDVRR